MVAVNEITIDVILNGKKATMDLKRFSKEMKKLEGIGKKANGVFKNFLRFAGVSAFAKMALDASRLGRSISLLADRTGIATGKLIGMRTAFSAMGGDAKAMDRTLGSISRGLAGLSMGDGETAAKLAAMNISAWDNNGQIKKADVVWGDIADWTKRQLDAGRTNEEVASFLERTFGTTYEEFKALALGRGGFAKQQAKLNAETGVIDKRQTNNLEEMFLTFNKLKVTIENLVYQISGDLAPMFNFIAELIRTFARGLQEVWASLSESFRAIIERVGGSDGVDNAFNALKTVIDALIKGLKLLVDYVIGPVVYSLSRIANVIGQIIAWLQDKLGWFFSSPREKERQRDTELARKAQERGGTLEEQLKWMSQQGSMYWEEQYNKFMKDKYGTFKDQWGHEEVEELFPVADGSEVMKASTTGKDTFVDVSVDNNWIENPDGTYTIMTDVDVNSSDGGSFTSSVQKAMTGGHI